jgi:porin
MRALLLGMMFAATAAGAHADDQSGVKADAASSGWTYSLTWTGEVAGPVSGGLPDRLSALDLLALEASFDLETIGWRGGALHLQLQSTSGRAPNDDAGLLEGLSNIEVDRPRAKVYELYLEQKLGDRSVLRGGFIDLNSGFYATDASALLTAPPFGIGTELAATGPAGPSIFPSTAPAITLHIELGDAGAFLSLGAFAAEAGNWGDPGGPLDDLDEGGLLIAEGGMASDAGRLAFGAWTYTQEQADLRTGGDEARAWGAYMLAERPIGPFAGADTTLFLRAGISDGRTGDFAGSWTGGVLMDGVLPGRPSSAASIGLRQAFLSDPARDAARAAGTPLEASEFGLEAVLADAVTDWLSVKGSVQFVPDPGADPERDAVVVFGLRLEVSL